MITTEELYKHINAHLRNQRRIFSQSAYFRGPHPAIYADSAKEDPDNRVPVTIPRKAVKFLNGYMFKPGSIVYTGDYYENVLKDQFNACEESILTSELAVSALVHGHAYELHWTDGGKDYFAEVPIEQSIMVYDDKLGIFSEPVYFIRYWTDDDGIQRAEVWDAKEKQAFIGPQWRLDGSAMVHGYKRVPVIDFKIARDGSNLFDHVLPLVDVLDKGMSEDVANELQRLANSYLLLANDIDATPGADGESEVDKIKRTKIIANLREDVTRSVAFLTKNLDPSFINSALDRIERLCYELIGIPNQSDDTFAASSGIALLYKLVPLEFTSSDIETYFSRGLQQRIRLMANLDATINGNSDSTEVSIQFHRNLPMDILSLAQTAGMLKGILSDETILKMFPASLVPDVEEELERLNNVMDIESVEDEPPAEEEPEEGPAEAVNAQS